MKVVLCSVQQKRVPCSYDGVCVRCGDSKQAEICPIREEALDYALNGC